MLPYKQIHLKQGSEEWLLWRRSHITATDSAKIMGKNSWSSPLDCYNEKIEGKKTFITPAMQRGMDLESKAVNFLIDTYKINLKAKVFRMTDLPFMGASLDAISDDNKTLYEVKCPGENTMEKVMRGEIGKAYTIQCNKQMLVMDLYSMKLFYYFNDFIHIEIKIKRDEKLVKEIIKSDTKFWNKNILPKIPPEKYGDDYEKIQNEKANELAKEWFKFNDMEKEGKLGKENIVVELEKYTNKKNCIFTIAGLKHQHVERKGSVDWKGISSSYNISNEEIDKYRKEKSSFSKFSEM